MLPILHVNGYKIANPTIYGTMSDEELIKLFEGFGWHPMVVEGDDLDRTLASALDVAYGEIRELQRRGAGRPSPERPRWPMLIAPLSQGLDRHRRTRWSPHRGHLQGASGAGYAGQTNPEHLEPSSTGCAPMAPRSCSTRRAVRARKSLAMCPTGEKRMGANPHVNGGRMRVPLQLPELTPTRSRSQQPGAGNDSALGTLGKYLADVFQLNRAAAQLPRSFARMRSPPTASGRVFEVENHAYEWPVDPEISPDYDPDGRIMEVLSEHNCQGWLQGYVLTGRHGVFPCYEAFIPIVDGMVNQYGKFLKMSREEAPWREPVASLNYLLTSVGWRQDHNGYSHQMPGFINSMLNRREEHARVYLPPDSNTLLATMAQCLESTG